MTWGQPYPIATDGATPRLGAALGYDVVATLGAPSVLEGRVAQVQMTPGLLTATTVSG